MNVVTKGYSPEDVLGYFEKICSIPHGSGNEQGIADYLCEFARAHSLEYYRDGVNNVFIKKPASAGYSDRVPIMLQGHMDMVCEKEAGCAHDFLNDPIDIYVENGKLRARGTTLGGDDGIAVAYILAILASDSIEHPDLECLITTGEETLMIGAGNFDYSRVKARRVINIDSEEEGIVTVSCAGGADVFFTLEGDLLPHTGRTLKLELSGFAGGHSGTDINTGRANSICVMGRLLEALYAEEPFNIVSVDGGNKMNAISRECCAEIYVGNRDDAEALLKAEFAKIKRDLVKEDNGARMRISKGQTDAPKFAYKDSSAIINMMRLYNNGVIAMSADVPGFVRTSANLGRIRTEGGKVTLGIMARSSSDSEMELVLLDYARLSKAIGVNIEISDRHAGWASNPRSTLSKAYVRIYNELYGDIRKAEIAGIHAGLECGLIIAALGDETDAISIGPDMRNVHTPDEELDLISVEHTWNALKELLKA